MVTNWANRETKILATTLYGNLLYSMYSNNGLYQKMTCKDAVWSIHIDNELQLSTLT